MEFPLILVKGEKEAKCLHSVDLKGWLDAGWEIKTDVKKVPAKKEGLAGLSKEALIKVADAKNIEVDKRWGEDKLIEEISKV